ncbi:2-phosphosulfolactate phosphatase [Goodfellowiella coeruleoviolacea]|nr:2-phosphosulfolactate phosphatase [Goodfellowiella coeruleoviolacea]
MEWGGEGVTALAGRCAVLVVVDVLSFATSVDLALGRGGRVLPLPWRDERAAEAARAAGAVLAGEQRWTLRPSSLVDLPRGTLLALPSPNGATLCARAAGGGCRVLVGCLRNARAVAAAAVRLAGGGPIGVIAAGERWGVVAGPLRPGIEDLLGAGAVISALVEFGHAGLSPEAEVAAIAYRGVADGDLVAVLAGCCSGRELIAQGDGDDVVLAAEHGVSAVAPVLVDGVLEPA